jgi:16S rRNA (guanine(1405)-N(7))-methyltransferase
MNTEDKLVQALKDSVINTKKYRHLGLNPATIEDLIRQEAPLHPSHKAVLKAVKRKLHNIVAPYLGEPDYAALTEELIQIEDDALDSPRLKAFCLKALSQHASTAERIPSMSDFYRQLFQAAGKPQVILDLACGLHPLAFPWMGLPTSIRYHAYDIIQPRVDFINTFFNKIGLAPLAENRDILVNPPEHPADLGIFFQEAHRFEKRQPGCNTAFWETLNVEKLAVSLPSTDLSGTHSLLEGHRKLVYANLSENKSVDEIMIGNEIIYLIQTSKAAQNV